MRPSSAGSAAASGAWAAGWRYVPGGDVAQTIPSGAFTSLTFAHFRTSDASVFASGPGGVAGDVELVCLQPGVYVLELGLTWQAPFAAGVFSDVSISGSAGFDFSHPANSAASAVNPNPVGKWATHSVAIAALTAADVSGGGNVMFPRAYQQSGVPKNAEAYYLRAAFFPSATTYTDAY